MSNTAEQKLIKGGVAIKEGYIELAEIHRKDVLLAEILCNHGIQIPQKSKGE